MLYLRYLRESFISLTQSAAVRTAKDFPGKNVLLKVVMDWTLKNVFAAGKSSGEKKQKENIS